MADEKQTPPEDVIFDDSGVADGSGTFAEALGSAKIGPATVGGSEESVTTDTDTETVDENPETEKSPETASTDTDTETVPDLLQQKMADLGLTGRYKTAEQVLEAFPQLNQKFEDRGRELHVLRQIIQDMQKQKPPESQPTKNKLSRDEALTLLNDDPEAFFDYIENQRGYVKKDALGSIEKSVEEGRAEQAVHTVAAAVERHPELKNVAERFRETMGQEDIPKGLNPRWDAMMDQLALYPDVKGLPSKQAISILYKLTASPGAAPAPKPKVSLVPQKDKEMASTTPGSSVVQPHKYPADFNKWGVSRRLKYLEQQGLLAD